MKSHSTSKETAIFICVPEIYVDCLTVKICPNCAVANRLGILFKHREKSIVYF